MNNLSILETIPAEEYHAAAKAGEYLSSHLLGDFRACPMTYHQKMIGQIVQPETDALLMGRAAHTLILEGHATFDDEYLVADGPLNPKTNEPYGRATKAYASWLLGQHKTVISRKEYGFLCKLEAAVWWHEMASILLTNGFAEGTVRTNYCDEPCQIRIDYFNPDYGIVDLKTCDDLTWFDRDIHRLGYIYQLAFYRAVLREASGETVPVHIVGVEKREPFRVGVWHIGEAALDAAEVFNAAAIRRLQHCRDTNHWPTLFEDVREITEL